MSKRPSDGIGKRISFYRQLSGLSARELAEKAGMGLTRGVVANIESGRKTDITVDQLLAIADVLGVPPVVIALPVEQPFRFTRITDGESQRVLRAWLATRFFNGEDTLPIGPEFDDGHEETITGASAVALERLDRVTRYLDARASLSFLRATAPNHPRVPELEAEVPELERKLQQLQVDLTEYKVDD